MPLWLLAAYADNFVLHNHLNDLEKEVYDKFVYLSPFITV